MLDMIDFVYEMHAITKGVFTPLVGNHLQALGYGRITFGKPSNTNKTPNKLKKFNLQAWESTLMRLFDGIQMS